MRYQQADSFESGRTMQKPPTHCRPSGWRHADQASRLILLPTWRNPQITPSDASISLSSRLRTIPCKLNSDASRAWGVKDGMTTSALFRRGRPRQRGNPERGKIGDLKGAIFSKHLRGLLRIPERESGEFKHEFLCVFPRHVLCPPFALSPWVLIWIIIIIHRPNSIHAIPIWLQFF